MKNFKTVLLTLLIGIIFSFSVFEVNAEPIICKDFKGLFVDVKKQINFLDNKFDWNNPNCKIVATKSVFPKNTKFETGLQLFIYQDNQLKFICLPGWICKSW